MKPARNAMTILGLNAYHGDSSAAVVSGLLISAVEEERFNRLKHWAGLPVLAAQSCLNGEIPDHVAVSRDPKPTSKTNSSASPPVRRIGLASHPAPATASVFPASARTCYPLASLTTTRKSISSSTTAPIWPALSSARHSTKPPSSPSMASATSAASCGASAAATKSKSGVASDSRTRWESSTPPSRNSSASPSTATSTR